ncbi:MAG TPA: hypothetical protein VGM39_03750 [Kofleriaceae bacterium]
MRLIVIAAAVTALLALLIDRAASSTHPTVPDGAPPLSLPPRDCIAGPIACAELIEIPPRGYGYIDQRLEDEVTRSDSTSFARRDLVMLVRYAAAKVARDASAWRTGNGGDLVLGDASEADGATPGTHLGRIRHPLHTHEDGRDIDIAYYQRNTRDNALRPVCRHWESVDDSDYRDAYRCTGPAKHLDAWRTAFLVAAFLESPRVRVIGMDARVAQRVVAVLSLLCSQRLVDQSACERVDRIAFESHDMRKGWFISHHNHLHVSLLQ